MNADFWNKGSTYEEVEIHLVSIRQRGRDDRGVDGGPDLLSPGWRADVRCWGKALQQPASNDSFHTKLIEAQFYTTDMAVSSLEIPALGGLVHAHNFHTIRVRGQG